MTIWPPLVMLSRICLWLVTLFYVHNVYVQLINIAGLAGYDWPASPLKWQIIDVLSLTLSAIVVFGLIGRHRVAIYAFFVASIGQVLLYTAGREWVLDVPEEFMPVDSQIAYLDAMILVHAVAVPVVAFAIWTISRAEETPPRGVMRP